MKGITRLALQYFKKKVGLERKLEETKLQLNDMVAQIPSEDMDKYVRLTEKISTQEDEKLQTFLRRREKRIKKAERIATLRDIGYQEVKEGGS